MRPILLALLMLFSLTTPASAGEKLDGPTALYELRTYYPAPGKAAALNARFREHTLGMLRKRQLGPPRDV
jgi:hypothetical protein